MNDNIKFIVEFFKGKEYPENFIRGLLRNFRTETADSFNPKQIQLSAIKTYEITNDEYVSRVDKGTSKSYETDRGRRFIFQRG